MAASNPNKPDVGDMLLVIRESRCIPRTLVSLHYLDAAYCSARRLNPIATPFPAPCPAARCRYEPWLTFLPRTADDFQARSSDELSLTKGDRVELLERDDEFGDGWYLGKHLVNGNSGLFPEGASANPACRALHNHD